MADTIKISFRHEFFQFLGIDNDSIGKNLRESAKSNKDFTTTVICPDDYSGLSDNIRVVSFMASAEFLLRNGYVLRKDSWACSEGIYYQRLLEKAKIMSLRKFIAKNKEAFLNNVIIALPEDTRLSDKFNNRIDFTKVKKSEIANLTLQDRINSLCIIDGQHRIFAHYEDNDEFESDIRDLRSKLYIYVTGIIYPDGFDENKKRTFESKVFLDINSNAKKVPAEILNYIQSIKDPFLDASIAREVIVKLNRNGVFESMFQLSSVVPAKIKIASIIKFALKSLVRTIDDPAYLFNYLSTDMKKDIIDKKSDALGKYILFCSEALNDYFAAVKKAYSQAWNDDSSKLLSVISINGFILAYKDTLPIYGLKNIDFYFEHFSRCPIDFTKENFAYTSSGYNKFSEEILERAFQVKTV